MSAQYAVITLSELPPSVNKMYGNNKKSSGRGRYKTPYYLAWIESSGWEIRDQKPPHVAGPYCMTMRCGRKNKRADISNIIKACEDLVVAHHVVEDDSLCRKITAEWVSEPGVHIMVVSTKEVA